MLSGCYMAGATYKCCRLGARSVYTTIQPCTTLQCQFMWSHICRGGRGVAVTHHLHFWQNDQDLLHAAAVTQGWNRYQKESPHRKLTREKIILPLLLSQFKPKTFWSSDQHSNHWAIPTPHTKITTSTPTSSLSSAAWSSASRLVWKGWRRVVCCFRLESTCSWTSSNFIPSRNSWPSSSLLLSKSESGRDAPGQ